MPRSRTNPRDRLLAFLQKLEVAAAPPPSVREVCDELGYHSPNAALKLIHRLQKSRDVIYEPKRARSLRLRKKPHPGVPLLGSITAGFPDEPGVDPTERLPLDPASFGIRNPAAAFALRVRGDSMIGRHFLDGDLVLLDRAAEARHLDVVAALIDQECSLKTLVIQNGKTLLKAENPAYPDLIPAHDLEIQGVAKAVIRIITA
ncbi:LexA family protein [Haloferula sargassicola]|uniref:LexA repressor n=1 Tax=Haloferula sargassicola TaxID=490096 RepID=A0ABP9UIE4_9BACT